MKPWKYVYHGVCLFFMAAICLVADSALRTASAAPPPEISAVTPSLKYLQPNTPLSFELTGTNLGDGLKWFLDSCGSGLITGGSATSKRFACTPTKSGTLAGLITNQAGKTLKTFSLTVAPGPTVSGVSPAEKWLQQGIPASFSVAGANLVDGLDWRLEGCGSGKLSGGNDKYKTFSCTPSGSGNLTGQIVSPSGNVLNAFTVAVTPAPVVNSVVPAFPGEGGSAMIQGSDAAFLINGTNLPKGLQWSVPGCSPDKGVFTSVGPEYFYKSWGFRCAPLNAGTLSGQIFTATGTVIQKFSVPVVPMPRVLSVTPATVEPGKPVTITAHGIGFVDGMQWSAFGVPLQGESERPMAVGRLTSVTPTSGQFVFTTKVQRGIVNTTISLYRSGHDSGGSPVFRETFYIPLATPQP